MVLFLAICSCVESFASCLWNHEELSSNLVKMADKRYITDSLCFYQSVSTDMHTDGLVRCTRRAGEEVMSG